MSRHNQSGRMTTSAAGKYASFKNPHSAAPHYRESGPWHYKRCECFLLVPWSCLLASTFVVLTAFASSVPFNPAVQVGKPGNLSSALCNCKTRSELRRPLRSASEGALTPRTGPLVLKIIQNLDTLVNPHQRFVYGNSPFAWIHHSCTGGSRNGWEGWTSVGTAHKKEVDPKSKIPFVIAKYIRDINQGQNIAPDPVESILQLTRVVKQDSKRYGGLCQKWINLDPKCKNIGFALFRCLQNDGFLSETACRSKVVHF